MKRKSRFLLVTGLLVSSMLASAVASAEQDCTSNFHDSSANDYVWGTIAGVVGIGGAILLTPGAMVGSAPLAWFSGSAGVSGATALYRKGYDDGKMATIISEAKAGDGPNLRIVYGQARAKNPSLTFDEFRSMIVAANNQGALCAGHMETASDLVNAAKGFTASDSTPPAQTGGNGAKAN